jgi:hypothetical protein
MRTAFVSFVKRLKKILRVVVVLLPAAMVAGAPGGWGVHTVNALTKHLSENTGLATARGVVLYQQGLQLVLATLIGVTVSVLIPALWRRLRSRHAAEFLAWVFTQLIAVAFGLLVPVTQPNGWIVGAAFGGTLTVAWLHWLYKWRGVGVAPSPLTGVLKPTPRAGQVWFAYIVGTRNSKLRPVILLNNTGTKWQVAYLTSKTQTGTPREGGTVYVKTTQMRGIALNSWVMFNDLRELRKQKLRSYVGLCPEWLYFEVCSKAGVTPDGKAWTLKETTAGAAPGVVERAVRTAFGSRDNGSPKAVFTREDLLPAVKFFTKTPIEIHSTNRSGIPHHDTIS